MKTCVIVPEHPEESPRGNRARIETLAGLWPAVIIKNTQGDPSNLGIGKYLAEII